VRVEVGRNVLLHPQLGFQESVLHSVRDALGVRGRFALHCVDTVRGAVPDGGPDGIEQLGLGQELRALTRVGFRLVLEHWPLRKDDTLKSRVGNRFFGLQNKNGLKTRLREVGKIVEPKILTMRAM